MKKILVSVLAFALPVMAFASIAPSPSPCDVVGSPFLQITQNITNDPDSGVLGNWAVDAFTENITAWVGTDGATNCASATVSNGTFVTAGGISPEVGTTTAPDIAGTFTGGENYTLGALVDPTMSTTTLTSVNLPDSSTSNFSSWVSQYFVSHNVDAYSLTYVTDRNGTWTDADAFSGGDAGDITGDVYVAPVVIAPAPVIPSGNGAPVGLLGTINTQSTPSLTAPVVTVSPVSFHEALQQQLVTLLMQLVDLYRQIILAKSQ